MVVVVSAPWAGPSRPAPTVLRELARRWGGAMQVLIVEDPSDAVLDAWSIEVLPTWLRFVPAPSEPSESAADAILPIRVDELTGHSPDGELTTLLGPWNLVHRRTGAQPKHIVEAEFGPESPAG